MTEPVLPVITRFAPSPTGFLHLGHVHSCLFAVNAAKQAGGRFLLRIEDIDPNRCRPEYEVMLKEDLAWIGFRWEEPVRRQSDHMDDYAAALDRLAALGVTYPCFCSRKDIADEIARAGNAPHLVAMGPEGPLYPGICRHVLPDVAAARMAAGEPHAIRLNVAQAAALTGPLVWHDRGRGTVPADTGLLGDIVLARRDVRTSYHLSVTVDDAIQDVSLVTRGVDLFHATHVHRLLQALLSLPVPDYHHHDLLLNNRGERLSKRDGATGIRILREQGATAEEVLLCARGWQPGKLETP
ncbi:tRNA glutamyl-Q(34) synthetase GluQRS [Niveispirillum cyanobacteriorum]|uniref:tRNA glutamyl-Q(34) synthetase GluQRS n=1 Tax=Niveispirillum cyanobacteriorum TaxID=1612173 RepID=A0A2K9NBQ1_9PROT|nr:tRNA glutamyl-Q(34) synthetase GluQRS [Niveispirillum cyanobacteriorum]AUN30544.1 tRNA glutamyl-Q(34) synthetase GluQRS [Niveispirillum cyanobacteriorum]GGE53537.1 tRNA glutamyl-Q(34) synthetase GluQRS [Niveispirillum cyanobacteriorum]